MTKLFLTYRLKQELPYWTGYHSENPNIDPRLCFGLTWESLDDCQANMERSCFNPHFVFIIYFHLIDLKIWDRLIWHYDPGWTDNAISAQVCNYGSFNFDFIAYVKCVIFLQSM